MSNRPHYEFYAVVRGHLVSTMDWLRLQLESLRPASQNHNEASYNALNKDEYDSDDLHPTIGRSPLTWRCLALGLAERLVWMLCNAVLLSVIVIQHFNTQMHSYETGFATDLGALLPPLRVISKVGQKIDKKSLMQLWQHHTSRSKRLSTLAVL